MSIQTRVLLGCVTAAIFLSMCFLLWNKGYLNKNISEPLASVNGLFNEPSSKLSRDVTEVVASTITNHYPETENNEDLLPLIVELSVSVAALQNSLKTIQKDILNIEKYNSVPVETESAPIDQSEILENSLQARQSRQDKFNYSYLTQQTNYNLQSNLESSLGDFFVSNENFQFIDMSHVGCGENTCLVSYVIPESADEDELFVFENTFYPMLAMEGLGQAHSFKKVDNNGQVSVSLYFDVE